jgi:hypothetical protein
MELKGLDELQKKLETLEKIKSVPLGELMPPIFMTENTQFESVEGMFESGGFKADNEEDFKAIPDNELDEFISKNTKFQSWQDMLNSAGEEFIKNKLNL